MLIEINHWRYKNVSSLCFSTWTLPSLYLKCCAYVVHKVSTVILQRYSYHSELECLQQMHPTGLIFLPLIIFFSSCTRHKWASGFAYGYLQLHKSNGSVNYLPGINGQVGCYTSFKWQCCTTPHFEYFIETKMCWQ